MTHWLQNVVPVDLEKAMDAMKLTGRQFSKEDVQLAYKRRCMETRCHPDQDPTGSKGDLFKRLTAARDLLVKSFDKPKGGSTFGARRSQGPIGENRRKMVDLDEVLKVLRSCDTLMEAIQRLEAQRG